MAQPVVDVVILTWNDGLLLQRAVDSVFASVGIDARLVVVDNGSEPPVHVGGEIVAIRNAINRGVAPARNQGVRAGSAPLVCLLDSDATLRPDSLAILARAVLATDDVALAGPVFVDQPPEASAGVAPSAGRKLARVLGWRDDYAGVHRAVDAPEWDVDFCIGACQVFRREAYSQVGGLDDSYFYGPEDVDFCLRLREAGWRIVQRADAPVEHPPRRRNRRLLSRRGMYHAWAVARHLWRHRRFRSRLR
ncbi:MAG: glycosyltransferase family 2 protein [Acidimicrobiia bacterium]